MVNKPKKANKTPINTINSISKSRQQINQENYQKNQEKLKLRQKERYQQQKEKEKKQLNKYYQASNIRVLMSFKNYTELNKDKRKLWQDFNWTLKDFQEAIKEGLDDIVAIMKLRESADNLIKDYWETAKGEIKKGKSWNSLSEEQQNKLIKYWGYEKTRIENSFLTTAEELERKSQAYLKDIELAKFHEERGKDKCPCYQCSESKRIQGEIKSQILKDEPKERSIMIEGECSNCYQYKKVDSESGLCRKCGKE